MSTPHSVPGEPGVPNHPQEPERTVPFGYPQGGRPAPPPSQPAPPPGQPAPAAAPGPPGHPWPAVPPTAVQAEHPTDPHHPVVTPNGGGEGWWNLFESAAEPPPPPPPQKKRRPVLIGAIIAAVLALGAIVTGIIVVTNGSDAPTAPVASGPTENTESTSAVPDPRLVGMLPRGISADSCAPGDDSNQKPSIVCEASGVDGGPTVLTMLSATDKAGLDAAFKKVIGDSQVMLCPGNIQSPGPWRRKAAPKIPAGTLMCGFQGKNSVVAWTDESRLLVVVAEGKPGAPALAPLYRWWSQHS